LKKKKKEKQATKKPETFWGAGQVKKKWAKTRLTAQSCDTSNQKASKRAKKRKTHIQLKKEIRGRPGHA